MSVTVKKTHQHGPRSVTPDGRKIKELRRRRNKTQKELLHGHYEEVKVRTYQRAEQGKPISRDNLEAIANILEVEVGELIAEDNVGESDHLRLKRHTPASGSKLFATLRDQVDDLQIEFECEPGEEQAEKLAETCELLTTIQRSGESGPPWGDPEDDVFEPPAEKVKAIGRLNSAIGWLEKHEIRLFCGVYVTWGSFKSEIKFSGPRGAVSAYAPCKIKSAKIVFSSVKDDHIRSSKRQSGPRDGLFGFSIQQNLENKLKPADVDLAIQELSEFPWETDNYLVEFASRYRKAFVDRFEEPQTATDDEPDVPF